MKVLVIGSGGREHVIAYALSLSPKVDEIHAIPGNPGIAQLGTCHPKSVEDLEGILNFVEENDIDFTVIGPEVPLCMGLADILEDHGHKVFGPRKQAAEFEGSKAFSKNFMARHHIPTATYQEVNTYEEAVQALSKFSYPVVVKADGLAAGKGVIICENEKQALEALKEIMVDHCFQEAGNKVVLEEYLTGFECSLLCFVDGKSIVPMVSAKDHKQIYDGNLGPNTGGMGSVSPNPFMPEKMDEILQRDILDPFMKGLQEEKIDYRGVLFIGLMIENQKAKVLEFNVRFGDPETQAILLRLDTDLFEIMQAVSNQTLDQVDIQWKDETSFCLVLASQGYPAQYEKGKVISGLDQLDKDILVFHAGTKLNNDQFVTSGGRVLNVCVLGKSLDECRQKAYQAADKIVFEGKYYRKDIGLI